MEETIEKREAPVVRRIFGLLSERGKTERGLAEYLAVKQAAVSGWKRHGGFLFKKYIYEICDYLDMTPNYLFFEPEEDKLSPEELKILQRYRRLSSTKKKCIMDELRELVRGSSINFVSWYFCVATCSYFVFPWVLRRVEMSYDEKKARISLFVLYCMQVLMGIIGSRIPSHNFIPNGWLRDDFTAWFIFNFPPVRAIDFIIGCNLGYLFLCRKDKKVISGERLFTIAELLTGGNSVLYNSIYLCETSR